MSDRIAQHGRWRRHLVRLGSVSGLVGLIGFGVWIGYRQVQTDALFREAERAAERRDFKAALAHYDRYLAERPANAEAVFLAARAARRAGEFRRATELLERAQGLGWVENALVLEWALLRTQQGGLRSEQAFLVDCVRRNHPDSVLIIEVLVVASVQLFDVTLAQEALDRWIELEPNNANPHIIRGDLLMRQQRRSEAASVYAEAVRVEPDNSEARLAYADALLHINRSNEALPHFEWLAERQPDSPDVLRGLAHCRMDLGELGRAREMLEELLRQRPEDPTLLLDRGLLALRAREPAVAEGFLRRALEVSRRQKVAPDLVLYYNLARCLDQLGKPEEAQKFRAAEKEAERDLKRLAELLRTIGQAADAPGPRCEAGQLLLRHGQDHEGLHWLYTALRADPSYGPAHEALADYYERQGDLPRAESHRRLAKPAAANRPAPAGPAANKP